MIALLRCPFRTQKNYLARINNDKQNNITSLPAENILKKNTKSKISCNTYTVLFFDLDILLKLIKLIK